MTVTAAIQYPGLGTVVLAPVPARQGDHVVLFYDKPTNYSRWEIFNVAGERAAVLSFTRTDNQFWDTTGAAPGVYFVRIQITDTNGAAFQFTRKAIVIP